MKKILLALLLLLLLAGGGYYLWQQSRGEADLDMLTLYGNVDIRDVALGFRVAGRIAEMRFEEGDKVAAGQVMAVLDKEPFEEDLALAEAELASAKASLQKFETGSRPDEIAQARAVLRERQAEYDNALRIYKRNAELVKTGAVSVQAYDDAIAARDQAKARLETAQEALDLALEGFRQEEILQARAAVDAAQARVNRTETRLKDTAIIAPATGTILTRVREPGSIVAEGAPVYTLSLDNPVWVRSYVDEPNLGNVFPGQQAQVYTDSRPEQPYQGHVGFISPQAEFTPKNVETTQLRTDLVYRLRVIVDNADQGLRQGMPVTVKLALNDSESGESDGQKQAQLADEQAGDEQPSDDQ